MKTKISEEIVKKEIDSVVKTWEFKCDECSATETIISDNEWIRPDGWQWVYTNVSHKVLCKECYDKRQEYKKSAKFLADQDKIREILESLQDYFEDDGDAVLPAWYYEPEETDYILNMLKESLK